MSIKATYKRFQSWWAKPALLASLKWLSEHYWKWPMQYEVTQYELNNQVTVILDRTVNRHGTLKILLCGKPVCEMNADYNPYNMVGEFSELSRYNYGAWVEDILILHLKEKDKVNQAKKITRDALFEPLDED